MLQVQGILETSIYSQNLTRSADFYRRVFELDTLFESERLIALNVGSTSVLLIFHEGATADPVATHGGIIPGHAGAGPTHFAFSIRLEEAAAWERRLGELEVPIESTVTWEGGARSLYFRDPDGNLVELMTPGFWKLA